MSAQWDPALIRKEARVPEDQCPPLLLIRQALPPPHAASSNLSFEGCKLFIIFSSTVAGKASKNGLAGGYYWTSDRKLILLYL